VAATLTYRALVLGFTLLGAVELASCGGGGGYKTSNPAPVSISPSSVAASATTIPGTAKPQASVAAALKDPCAYLTVAEVEAAAGKTVSGDPVRVNDFVCRYQTTDGVINIGVTSPIDTTTFEQQTQANYGSGSRTLQMIPNLGDEAFAVNFGVAVHKGSTSITVGISPSVDPTGGDAAIALARLLLQTI
jgi:hypothetical protein